MQQQHNHIHHNALVSVTFSGRLQSMVSSLSLSIHSRINARGFGSLFESSRVSVEGFFVDYLFKTPIEVCETAMQPGHPHAWRHRYDVQYGFAMRYDHIRQLSDHSRCVPRWETRIRVFLFYNFFMGEYEIRDAGKQSRWVQLKKTSLQTSITCSNSFIEHTQHNMCLPFMSSHVTMNNTKQLKPRKKTLIFISFKTINIRCRRTFRSIAAFPQITLAWCSAGVDAISFIVLFHHSINISIPQSQ